MKAALYWRNTDGTEGPIVAGTRNRAEGQQAGDLVEGDGAAHWVPLSAFGRTRPGPPLAGDFLYLDLTTNEWFSNPPHRRVIGNRLVPGSFVLAVRWRDEYGRVTDRGTRTLAWDAPAARRKSIQPMRVIDWREGLPVVGPPNPTSGIEEGLEVLIAYFNTPGFTGAANWAWIERRENAREDGQPPNQEPQRVLEWTDRRDGALAWPTASGVAQPAGSINYFHDDTVPVRSAIRLQSNRLRFTNRRHILRALDMMPWLREVRLRSMAVARNLHGYLRDTDDLPIVDKKVELYLLSGDRAEPATNPTEPARLIGTLVDTQWTDEDGRWDMNVIPTIYLDLRNPYIVVIEDWGQAMLIMPDADTDFTDYLRSGSSPLPARQLPDPAAIPDGSTVISENNVWVAGNFIYRGRTAPVHPGSDPAIWIDENQSPPGIRWWTGLAWD